MIRQRQHSFGLSCLVLLSLLGCDRIVLDVLPSITIADITTEYVSMPNRPVAIDLKTWPNLTEAATFRVQKQPETGTITIGKDGLLIYVPNPSFIAGDDDFSVTVDPDGLAKKPTTIPITVMMVATDDKLPCHVGAVADWARTSSNKAVTISILKNDRVCDGMLDPSTLLVKAPPTNGTTTIQGETIVYTPNSGFTGKDSFIYYVSTTSTIASKQYVAVVTVTVGEAPTDCKFVLHNDTIVYRQVFATDSIAVPVLANDELCKLLNTPITIYKGSTAGSTYISKQWINSRLLQLIVYKPDTNADTTDQVTYQRCEGTTCQLATVTFHRRAPDGNCQLLANADYREVSLSQSVIDLKNGVLLLPVLQNDKLCQPLTGVKISNNPANANIIVLPGGILQYTLDTTPKKGTVAFAYELTDSQGNTSSAEVKIVVTD